MAQPWQLPFTGFPDWDPGGAIMTRDPFFYSQPQGTSVYDLIARGYNPGDPNAFFSALPNLTTPAGVGMPQSPGAGFFPSTDYSYISDIIDAMGKQQSAARVGQLAGGGLQAAQRLYQNANAVPSLSSMGTDTVPIDAFGAGVDVGATAPSALSSLSDTIGGAIGAAGSYLPYVGAALQLGQGLASGTDEGIQGGAIQAAGTMANMFLPGLGTALTVPLMDFVGPSKGWVSYPERIGQYATGAENASQGLSNTLAGSQNLAEAYNALLDFRGDIGSQIPYGGQDSLFTPWALHANDIMNLDPSFRQEQGVNPESGEQMYGLTTNSLSDLRGGNEALRQYLRQLEQGDLLPQNELFDNISGNLENALPGLPGATGSAHEGNLSFNMDQVIAELRNQLSGTVESIYGQQYAGPSRTLAGALPGATSADAIQASLDTFYGGIGNNYGANAPRVSTFGADPSTDILSGAIPDFRGLSDQSVTGALRQELLSAYSGVVNKTNPFTGRAGLPPPPVPTATGGSTGTQRQSTGTADTNPDALGSAIQDADDFITQGTGL